MSQGLILIIAAVVLAILVVWIFRSRFGAAEHIDTSATAVGAVTEAARNIVDEVAHKFEDSHKSGSPIQETAAPSNAAGERTTVTAIGIPAAVGAPDNLRLLKGVGPKLATLLTELGITRFDQIAAWGPAEVAMVDAHLGTFKGRIVRDNWVEQAGYLASGDTAGFEARFGKLDSAGNG